MNQPEPICYPEEDFAPTKCCGTCKWGLELRAGDDYYLGTYCFTRWAFVDSEYYCSEYDAVDLSKRPAKQILRVSSTQPHTLVDSWGDTLALVQEPQ